jgi:type IV secretory pathway component VirB8
MFKDLDPQEQEEYKEFIKRSVKDGSYYKDALDWYIFRYINPVCERTMLFFIAIIAGLTTYALILIVKNSLPLVEKVPVVIRAEDTSLYFPVIKKLKDSQDIRTVDEAVVKYLLVNYLKEREEYDFRKADIEALNRKFNAIRNNSSVQEYRNFQAFMSRENAASPIANFGKNITRKIEINSVNFKRGQIDTFAQRAKDFMSAELPEEVEIRYNTITNDSGKVMTEKYFTRITFKFSGVNEKRDTDEKGTERLDFLVISYKTYKIS